MTLDIGQTLWKRSPNPLTTTLNVPVEPNRTVMIELDRTDSPRFVWLGTYETGSDEPDAVRADAETIERVGEFLRQRYYRRTFAPAAPRTAAAEGWALLQRLSSVEANVVSVDVDEDRLTDGPDPLLWEGLPTSRWPTK